MKYNDAMRFAHPVLSPLTSDYYDSEFQLREFTAIEDITSWEITLSGILYLNQSEIEGLITSGKALCYLYIVCGETYYSSFEKININEWSLIIPPGSVRGRVEIRPIVFLESAETMDSISNLNEEFGNEVQFPANKPIAIGRLEYFQAGYQKLAPMESIFKLIKNDDIKDGLFEIKYEDQTVDIFVDSKLHDTIADMRMNSNARNILLSSIYLPCIIELLFAMANHGPFDSRWFYIMKAKCESYGIDYTNKYDYLKNAQILLKQPISLLESSLKELLK